ncbi:MAG: YihA family ribosome biogenesis GTP-binding protein [Candidatus Hydrogenedentes bacterium]|nr:YihA family ribosome biogenesis GTP-binding protein [Candidatus Hydrogenedentota bacterium]
MKIVSARFVTSAASRGQYPDDGRPEVAFAGRSNVGKSSLLNVLLNRKGLAKTSKTPGKTRLVNFFDVNGAAYFVDLPGYGFAKVSKAMQAEWARVITSYLAGRAPLRLVCHLIDSRHEPTPRDHELLDLLDTAQVPTLIVATKVDKLRASQLAAVPKQIRKHLGLDNDALVVPYSSITRHGLRDLWDVIDEALAR